jgi:hypothetical protein
MPNSNQTANRQSGKAWLGLALSMSLLFLAPASAPAGLFGRDRTGEAHTKALPKQDFLPPVATINPKIDPQSGQEEDIEGPVTLSAVTSPVIRTTPRVNRLDGYVSDKFKSEQLQNVLEIQKKIDEADLEYLWRATVEKNPVIRFSMEKLAAPADVQPRQSSTFLTKTLSTLLSGATLAATMVPGGGQYRDMGTMAVNNAMQNLINGRTQPTLGSLSPTEQIQMAGLIDDLKMKLIQAYQSYKSTLQTLADSHQTTIKNNNLYSKALSSGNNLAVMASGTAYYQALMNETSLRQKAKLHRLALERLAGREAVSRLELTARLDDSQTAINIATPLGVSPEVGPPAPTAQQVTTTKLESPSGQTMAMPLDLPQTMEISPRLSTDIGPPEPIPAPTETGKSPPLNPFPSSNEAIPMPMPEILHHD